jgi:hypothetical protein
VARARACGKLLPPRALTRGSLPQSPGVAVGSSAAKLSQLKARRQQQWHASQLGSPEPEPSAAHARAPAAELHPDSLPAERTAAATGPPPPAARLSATTVAPRASRAAADPPSRLLHAGSLELGHGATGASLAAADDTGAVKWAWSDPQHAQHASAASLAAPVMERSVERPGVGAAGGGEGGQGSVEWGAHLPTPKWHRQPPPRGPVVLSGEWACGAEARRVGWAGVHEGSGLPERLRERLRERLLERRWRVQQQGRALLGLSPRDWAPGAVA